MPNRDPGKVLFHWGLGKEARQMTIDRRANELLGCGGPELEMDMAHRSLSLIYRELGGLTSSDMNHVITRNCVIHRVIIADIAVMIVGRLLSLPHLTKRLRLWPRLLRGSRTVDGQKNDTL